nr:MAG TPA: hypothetical protein [Caudoviricetes sp.]
MNRDTKIVKIICTVVAIIGFLGVYAPLIFVIFPIYNPSTLVGLLEIFGSAGLFLLALYVEWRMEIIEEERKENKTNATGE